MVSLYTPALLLYTMSDPAYQLARGYPPGSGVAATSNDSSANAADLSTSFSSSGTSGIASGDGNDSGSSPSLHQRLVAAGVGVSREQGVRDLRSIIQ